MSDDLREKIAQAINEATPGAPWTHKYAALNAVQAVIYDGNTVIPNTDLDELLAAVRDELTMPCTAYRNELAEATRKFRRAVSVYREGKS